jgi:hypothetical protein
VAQKNGELGLEQPERLKELKLEDERLRRPVTNLSLEEQVPKDVAKGKL